jgi:hypothetical protein
VQHFLHLDPVIDGEDFLAAIAGVIDHLVFLGPLPNQFGLAGHGVLSRVVQMDKITSVDGRGTRHLPGGSGGSNQPSPTPRAWVGVSNPSVVATDSYRAVFLMEGGSDLEPIGRTSNSRSSLVSPDGHSLFYFSGGIEITGSVVL